MAETKSPNANGVKNWDPKKKRLVANGTGGFDLVDRAPRDKAMNAKKDARLKQLDENPGWFRSVTNAIGITGKGDSEHRHLERRAEDDNYYGPLKSGPTSSVPTPTTPKGPKTPRKGPATAAPKGPVATAPRAAPRKTISNVNSSDRGGYTTSRPDTGWGPGNTNPYAKRGSSALAKKGVAVKKASGNSAGKAFKGLKWFNGKD